MRTVEITLELEDGLADEFERMWGEGHQLVLQPENWKCWNEAPPLVIECETKES